MPMFNALQGRGPGWNALIRRLFLLGEGVSQVAPEIQPEVTIESDRPEWSYLKGEKLRASFASVVAGGAGFRGLLVLKNPAGSGLLFIVKGFYCNAAGTGVAQVGWSGQSPIAGLTDTAAATSRDPRASNPVVDQVNRVFQRNGVAAPSFQPLFIYPSTLGLIILDNLCDIVVPPGNELIMMNTVDNQNLQGGFYWIERPMTEQEA